ncbi:MAG: hypothetical protein M0R77_07695 [Gammaproteobacteria bacterium]|nr:hypothetical protein [Gammaproteobacteria bacterium]
MEDQKHWWNTPEGVEWLSNQPEIEQMFLESQQENWYCRGQRFYICEEGTQEYILASITRYGMSLICLVDGNRWSEPVEVENSLRVTKDEMSRITCGSSYILLEK